MNKITSILFSVLFFILHFSVHGQNVGVPVSCGGRLKFDQGLGSCNKITIGNGTAGKIKVCLETNGMSTGTCRPGNCGPIGGGSVVAEQINIMAKGSSTALATWTSSTSTGTCYTFTTTNGYADIAAACLSTGVVISWTTLNVSNVSMCCTPACSNGVKDCDETGVDCGGQCPSFCPTCFDGIKNGAETGIDCGGPCSVCPVSQNCAGQWTLQPGCNRVVLGNGTAGSVKVCLKTNSIGTSTCNLGDPGGLCDPYSGKGSNPLIDIMTSAGVSKATWTSTTATGTCVTLSTTDGFALIVAPCINAKTNITWSTVNGSGTSVCCTPNCSNGIKDCDETGVDCGGQCQSLLNKICSGTCSDNIQNQDESGKDCGGSICAACPTTCATVKGSTCASGCYGASDTIDATAGPATAQFCVSVKYNQLGSNWLHGVFLNNNPTGMNTTTLSATGITPPGQITKGTDDYNWYFTTIDFKASNTGATITENGWFVDTKVEDKHGNNYGYPGSQTLAYEFCLNITTNTCGGTGLTSQYNSGCFQWGFTADSYSGVWNDVTCGKETPPEACKPYIIKCPPIILPIDYTSFYGSYERPVGVKLGLDVVSERNIREYVLQRTLDGKSFIDIQVVPAENNSIRYIYNFLDPSPKPGINYYKVMITERNMGTSFTNTIAINVANDLPIEVLYINPVPSHDFINVGISSPSVGKVTLELINIYGAKIYSHENNLIPGENNLKLSLENFSSGFYFVKIIQDDVKYIRKIVKD